VLREQKELIHRIAVCIDAAVVGAAFLLVFLLKGNLEPHYIDIYQLPPLTDYLPVLRTR
jgi:hypothetical protein